MASTSKGLALERSVDLTAELTFLSTQFVNVNHRIVSTIDSHVHQPYYTICTGQSLFCEEGIKPLISIEDIPLC